MKVVFLDIDGVLNHWAYLKEQANAGVRPKGCTTEAHLDPLCVERLNDLLRRSGAKVVVSSTWRILHTIESLQETLEAKGFEGQIIDFTTRDHMPCRGDQIAKWLDDNKEMGIESFVILDDDADMGHLYKHWVQTHLSAGGLLGAHVEIALSLLETDTKETQ